VNKTCLHISLSILLALICSITSYAKEEVDKTPGLKIGSKAPDFELLNQQGEKTKLSELLKEGSVAVVFHRSANW